MDVNLNKIKKIVVPVGVIIGTCVGAIVDWKKSERMDELIEKVDELTKKDEE